ncbi:MAG TPA: response regulator transcription factor [Candidatus Dormibacteraeota bacterium]|jgi:DNA-binding NarL/FixJ family response regulator|nr:response regulator transcription factor [Candidatus Dormibacteraeota bacterium]
MTIRVAIADDQTLVRAGFRMIVESQPDMEIAGEAGDGQGAIDLVKRERPDVVLMDIRMPRMDGIAATRTITGGAGSSTRVVILTTYELDEYVFDALGAGASAFLLKAAPPEDLVRAIRVVASGDALLAPSVTRRLIEEFAKRPEPQARKAKQLETLTERERDVLREVARGLTNAEIAARLHVAETTVKTHVAHVLDKLQLRDRVQAVILAYEAGLAGV